MPVRRILQKECIRSATTVISVAVILLLLGACDQVQHRENGLVFGEWYIVKPVVDTGMTTGYGKVTNTHSETTTLDTVSLDCAEKVELHETMESGGRVSMLGLDSVTMKAGATITFQPGKKHLMITGLRQPASGRCTATFTFAGRSISFAIPVKERRD